MGQTMGKTIFLEGRSDRISHPITRRLGCSEGRRGANCHRIFLGRSFRLACLNRFRLSPPA